jgi:hypothetical protein
MYSLNWLYRLILSYTVLGFVIGSCGGQEISNNNVQIDFGLIETQCDCRVSANFSGSYFYFLANNPGYNGCGTAIEVTIDSNTTYRLRCSTQPPTLPGNSTNINHTLRFMPSNNPYDKGNSGYCVRVASNGRWYLFYHFKFLKGKWH